MSEQILPLISYGWLGSNLKLSAEKFPRERLPRRKLHILRLQIRLISVLHLSTSADIRKLRIAIIDLLCAMTDLTNNERKLYHLTVQLFHSVFSIWNSGLNGTSIFRLELVIYSFKIVHYSHLGNETKSLSFKNSNALKDEVSYPINSVLINWRKLKKKMRSLWIAPSFRWNKSTPIVGFPLVIWMKLFSDNS